MSELKMSLSPHIHGGDCIKRNTYGVIFALVPALLMAVFSYGLNAIYLGCYSLASCLLAEWLITRYLMRRPCSLADGTAVITAFVMDGSSWSLWSHRIGQARLWRGRAQFG